MTLEEALDREQLAARNKSTFVTRPRIVSSVQDIQNILSELHPAYNKTSVAPIDVQIVDSDNNSHRVQSQSISRGKREIILEALQIVKTRHETVVADSPKIEINGSPINTTKLIIDGGNFVWIDNLIKHWFGAYRDNLDICWDLNDGFVYKYNIWEHKLFKHSKSRQ